MFDSFVYECRPNTLADPTQGKQTPWRRITWIFLLVRQAPAGRVTPSPANQKELTEEKRQRLEELADWANAAHELAKDAALRFCRHSIEAGMALLEAHDLCPKEAWPGWLAEHFEWSLRTAQRYMRQAKLVRLMGVKTTDLSFLPPEELSRLMEAGLKRIERRHAAALTDSEAPNSGAVVEDGEAPIEIGDDLPRQMEINVTPPQPSVNR